MAEEDKNEQKTKTAYEQNANWTKEQYLKHLRDKAENHNYYKIYSSDTRITDIIDKKTLYLSDGQGWNDKIDRNNFCREGQLKRFAKCFSFSRSENVAMWLLYGGMESKGLMLNIKKSLMKDIVDKCDEVELGYWEKKNGKEEFVVKAKIPKDNFDLYLIDILYYGDSDEKGKYDLKRSSTKYELGEVAVIDQLSGCVKSYPWSYENEVRLILELKKENGEVTKIYDDKQITGARINFAKIFMKHSETDITIYESPNYKGKHHHTKSTLFEKIDWNLCSDCRRKSILRGKLKCKKCLSPVCPYYSKRA